MRKPLGKIRSESKKKEVRRKLSIRKKIIGETARPRVCVIKTNKHIQVQVIDDTTSKTIFAVQTFGKNKVVAGKNLEGAKIVGTKVAEKLKENKISTIVFDRNGKKYAGLLAALANTIRENGIQF
ncbi:MAG: 50S ribosomal protein L18 [Bacteriovoracaceae bacterium]|nr:50S ribosomal protein L18 [Bacteriovoracaceae bacterium]